MTMIDQANEQGREPEAIAQIRDKYSRIIEQLGRVLVGMEDVIEQVMVGLLCHGHCMLEGVPGVAKTLLVSSLGKTLGLKFGRVQFTPDLMPADITGTDVLEEDHTTGKRVFRFIKGPLFANIILADEINRTPPKTQSALLEAMQERQLTVGNVTYPLPHPFFVLATQNPIEQEGTYPLPEAQLDRFMLKIHVDYPSEAQEITIAKQQTTDYAAEVEPVFTAGEVERLQAIIRKVPVADHVYKFAVRLVRLTRPTSPHAPEIIRKMVAWGAGPRASIYLVLAAKARAVLQGRCHATMDDVAAMALPVLRHRVLPTFSAEAAGKTSDDILDSLLKSVVSSRSGAALTR